MDWSALISSVTALVVAVTALVGLILHKKSLDPHPGVMVPLQESQGATLDPQKGS